MRSGNQWNVKSTREFTPVQENSNEDELARLSVWLPDPLERSCGRKPVARADAGARRRDRDIRGDLECGDNTSTTTRQCTSGGRGATQRPCLAYAESGAVSAGFLRRANGGE